MFALTVLNGKVIGELTSEEVYKALDVSMEGWNLGWLRGDEKPYKKFRKQERQEGEKNESTLEGVVNAIASGLSVNMPSLDVQKLGLPTWVADDISNNLEEQGFFDRAEDYEDMISNVSYSSEGKNKYKIVLEINYQGLKHKITCIFGNGKLNGSFSTIEMQTKFSIQPTEAAIQYLNFFGAKDDAYDKKTNTLKVKIPGDCLSYLSRFIGNTRRYNLAIQEGRVIEDNIEEFYQNAVRQIGENNLTFRGKLVPKEESAPFGEVKYSGRYNQDNPVSATYELKLTREHPTTKGDISKPSKELFDDIVYRLVSGDAEIQDASFTKIPKIPN